MADTCSNLDCDNSPDCEECDACWICIEDGFGCIACQSDENTDNDDDNGSRSGPYGDPDTHGRFCGCPACK